MREWTSPIPFAQRLAPLTVSLFWTFVGVFGVFFALAKLVNAED